MSICWGLGSILGPIVGGFFSDISTKYPNIFPHDSLFGQYPYLFPCAFAAVISFIGAIAGVFFLEESLTSPSMPMWKAILSCFGYGVQPFVENKSDDYSYIFAGSNTHVVANMSASSILIAHTAEYTYDNDQSMNIFYLN